MNDFRNASSPRKLSARAFTIIELMVTVAIIALLMAILMPSLAEARKEARAVQCATNLKHVGTSVAIYQTRFNCYPVSYAYLDSKGRFDISEQGQVPSKVGPEKGYIHWSHFLYGNGRVSDGAFQCPDYDNGGAPRTNPGPDQVDWESGQVDARGQMAPNPLEDLQAPRMSYTANAAVMPRNKFNKQFSKGFRVNRLVSESTIGRTSNVILAAEFFNDWKNQAILSGGGNRFLSKSHRPVNPFYHQSYGADEYQAPLHVSGFRYGVGQGVENFGILPMASVLGMSGVIDGNLPRINVVGRHHPGGDKAYGGTSNFLYCDSHVERKTITESMKNREWGEKYYSINGASEVLKGTQ
jgi:prepilin-type N-terminal cleavage/methylation domain-containing protein/prepilin-type processing-associated H-X9-DG protein